MIYVNLNGSFLTKSGKERALAPNYPVVYNVGINETVLFKKNQITKVQYPFLVDCKPEITATLTMHENSIKKGLIMCNGMHFIQGFMRKPHEVYVYNLLDDYEYVGSQDNPLFEMRFFEVYIVDMFEEKNLHEPEDTKSVFGGLGYYEEWYNKNLRNEANPLF